MLENAKRVPTLNRIINAALLKPDTYEEIENDKKLTVEAGAIVVVVSLLVAFGALLGPGNFRGFIATAVIGLVGWVVWAWLTMFIGTKYFGGDTNLNEMLRVLGYASVPFALGIIPFVGLFVGSLWALAASIVAIRQGQDFSYAKAIPTAGIGWLILLVARTIFGWFL